MVNWKLLMLRCEVSKEFKWTNEILMFILMAGFEE